MSACLAYMYSWQLFPCRIETFYSCAKKKPVPAGTRLKVFLLSGMRPTPNFRKLVGITYYYVAYHFLFDTLLF